MLEVGMDVSERMQIVLDEYRSESDLLGGFFAEKILPAEGEKLKTAMLYTVYTAHMKLCAVKPISSQEFVGEVRKRYQVKHDYKLGNVIVDAKLANL